MGLSWQERENLKNTPAFPVHVRQLLIESAAYTLKAMPESIYSQRDEMLLQDDGLFEDGREKPSRTAQFDTTLHPEFPGFANELTVSVSTSHDQSKPPEYYLRSDGGASITLGIRLSGEWIKEDETIDNSQNDHFACNTKLKKFWLHVAEAANLKEATHNIVSIGEFQLTGYSQGKDFFRGIQFHPKD